MKDAMYFATFWPFLYGLEMEDKAAENLPYGRLSTKLWQEGKFLIIKGAPDKALFMYDDERQLHKILDISDYSIEEDTLYVIGEGSCAVVYSNDTCRLYFENGYRNPDADPSITYVDRFDQFTKAEQEAFNQLLNED